MPAHRNGLVRRQRQRRVEQTLVVIADGGVVSEDGLVRNILEEIQTVRIGPSRRRGRLQAEEASQRVVLARRLEVVRHVVALWRGWVRDVGVGVAGGREGSRVHGYSEAFGSRDGDVVPRCD